MISLIVPTRDRAHTLEKVLLSYLSQDLVSEIIIVSDAGTDATPALISDWSHRYPERRLKLIVNERRLGASLSRNVGVEASTNEFVLFCDDDEYLEAGYAKTCMNKLLSAGCGAVSGRRVYMIGDETKEAALLRFGTGLRRSPPFRPVICEYVNGAKYQGDLELPFTNAIILTRKCLLEEFPFDGYYAKGNGYREETDFQMNLFVHDIKILVTNECHSIHLPMSAVRTGGQRINRLRRIYWSIHYTAYFFKKYYSAYAQRVGIHTPRLIALFAFSIFSIYRELFRPALYQIWVSVTAGKREA